MNNMNEILKKVKNYDKRAKNPFLENEYSYNPFKSIYEQTYIWIEKPKDD
jgi:hypothetical protein